MTEPIEVESLDTAMLTCPYFQGVGTCDNACQEEPHCKTGEPYNGWQARDRRGRFIKVTPEQLKATAEQRVIDREARANELARMFLPGPDPFDDGTD